LPQDEAATAQWALPQDDPEQHTLGDSILG